MREEDKERLEIGTKVRQSFLATLSLILDPQNYNLGVIIDPKNSISHVV